MKYYCIDTETTGLKAGYNELTEISIIRCEDLVQKTWFIKIKHPDRASPQALAVTGKTVEELLDRGIYIEEAIPKINEFIEEDGSSPDQRVMIAHNYSFDSRMINGWWEALGSSFPADFWECTMEMARKYLKTKNPTNTKPTVNLPAVIEQLGIKAETKIHTAAVDIRNTFRVRAFLLKNGINEVDFIKRAKTTQTKIAAKTTADDSIMEDVFNFGVENEMEETADNDL